MTFLYGFLTDAQIKAKNSKIKKYVLHISSN